MCRCRRSSGQPGDSLLCLWRPWRRADRSASSESSEAGPIPLRFRPLIEEVVGRLAAGDFEGILRDGLVRDDSPDFAYWLEDYPATLAPLPADAWARERAFAQRLDDDSGWYFRLDLWTQEEGRSDLGMEGELYDEVGGHRLRLDNIHVP